MIKPIDDTIVYLEQLGLTQYEAKVYLALLSEHPATAYTISRRSGVPHSRVYEVARRLMAKGYVVCQNTNPDRFSPLSPRELVGRLAGEHERMVAGLKQRLDAIPFQSDFDPVWNIGDRAGALTKAREIIGEASRRIYIGVWDEELEELVDDLRRAHTRGVEIVFLIYGKSSVDFGHAFYHDTHAIKEITHLGRNVDIVADSAAAVSGWLGTEAVNGEAREGGETRHFACQVFWTKNRGLINVIEGYIIHDFYLAEIFGAFRKEIEGAFGANMKALRDKYHG
jgi:HTH-type transcriptional regulator, sugar sensing transcriptional regulator